MIPQPIKYHGGKKYLASSIIDIMPPHVRYCEPFAGGLSVLLRKDPFDKRHVFNDISEGCSEYVNDLNGNITAFWSVLANPEKFIAFQRVLEACPLSETVFSRAYDVINNVCVVNDQMARAVAFFIVNRQSRQGLGKSYCTPTRRTRRGMNEHVSAWLTAVDGLAEIHDRLRRVEVWNRDFQCVIDDLDDHNTLFYCDPPYMMETRGNGKEYGRYEMEIEDHERLLRKLSTIRGKFILSGYASDLYCQYAHDHRWSFYAFDLPNNASGAKIKGRKTEILWIDRKSVV